MYKTFFAIDEVPFRERKNNSVSPQKYLLDNYSYYEDKLENDFYLRVFMKQLLFDIDILEVEAFLNTQYEKCESQSEFTKVLRLKVIPKITSLIKNAEVSLDGTGTYYKQTELEDGFVETEGKIANKDYEWHTFSHKIAALSLEEDLIERKNLIKSFILKVDSHITNITGTLKWAGKPSHLAIIIRRLVNEGYIEAPLANDKEINLTELSRQILLAFEIENGTTINTLRTYLNPNLEANIKLTEKFDNEGFSIPDSGLLG